MARIKITDLVNAISHESIEHPNTTDIKLEVSQELPKDVKEDTEQRDPTDEVDAEATNTKTSEPGPEFGGGDGTAETVEVKKVNTKLDVTDLDEGNARDQQGGEHVDILPNQVKLDDKLSSSDVSTSVESHDESDGDGEEGKLKSIETGGAEEVGEANCLVMDIEDEAHEVTATGILTNTELDAEVVGKLHSEIGELENAKASIESYRDILATMRKEGIEMSPQLKQWAATSLKTISQELFTDETIALETIDDDEDGFDSTRDKVEKGLSGKIKQVAQAIWRAIMRGINALNDLWTSFTQDTGKVQEHLKDLEKRVSKLVGGETITLNSAQRLMIMDEFVGDSREALVRVHKTANELLIDYPTKIVAVLKTIADTRGTKGQARGSETIGLIIESFENTVETAFRSYKPLSTNDRDLVPSGFLGVNSLKWSEPLPGNRAVYVGVERTQVSNIDNIIKEFGSINKVINVNFSAIPGTEQSGGKVDVETMTAVEAKGIIKELGVILGKVSMYKQSSNALKEILTKGNKIGKSEQTVGAFTGNDSQSIAGIMGMGIARAAIDNQHQFVGYLLNLIKAYIGYMEGCLKAESTEKVGATIDA